MTRLLVVILAFALTACSSGSDNKNETKKSETYGGPDSTVTMTDITDTSSCSGPVPAGRSVYSRWKGVQSGGGITLTMRIRISSNSLEAESTCAFPSTTLSVSAISSANVTSSSISVLENSNQSTSSGNATCRASTNIQTVNYALVGNCLKLTVGGDSALLVYDGF